MQSIKCWPFMVLILLLGYVWPIGIHAGDIPRQRSVRSPSHTVALLELYTSEG